MILRLTINQQWPIEKIRQVVWDALHGYGRIEWKQSPSNLEKLLDVAYQDVINEFDSTEGGHKSYYDLGVV